MQINFYWKCFNDSLITIKNLFNYPVKKLFDFKFEKFSFTGFDWFTRKITVVNPKTFFNDFFLNRQMARILKKLEGKETAENLLTVDESIFVLRLQKSDLLNVDQKKFIDRLTELKLIPPPSEDPFANYNIKSEISSLIAHLIRLKIEPKKKLSLFSASLSSFSPRILSPKPPCGLIVVPSSKIAEDPLQDFETWAELLNTNLNSHSEKLQKLPFHSPFQVGDRIYYKGDQHRDLPKIFLLAKFIAAEGGLGKLAEKLERNELDLCSAACLVSLYFYFQHKFDHINSEALTSGEAKALYSILDKIREMEIGSVNAYDVGELTHLKIFFYRNFNGKSLVEWNALLSEICEFGLNRCKQIKKFEGIASEDKDRVLEKIQKMLDLGQQLSQIPNEAKLSVKEYYIYKCLAAVSALHIRNPLFTDPIKDHLDLLKKFAELEKRGTKPFVRVCIKRFSRDEEDKPAELKSKLEQFCVQLFKDQGHTNFIFQNQLFKTYCIGIDRAGYYKFKNPISKTPKFEEFKIKVKALFPQNNQIDLKGAKEIFFQKLRANISTRPNGTYPRLSELFSTYFVPYQFKTTNPQGISFDGKNREMLCSQYVCEAIMMAHIQTCREMGIEPPHSLSYYGLSDRQRMEVLVPHRFSTAFIKKGILKPIKAVAWQT